MTAGLSFAYTHDPLGRLKVVTESDSGATVSVRCHTYDAAGRLAGVYSASDAAMATCTGSPIASYGYDTNGNRVSSTGAATVATSAATIDEQDRLMALTVGGVATTFAYTARGELYTRTSGSDVTAYRYDALGALASVTLPDASVVQYRNDPQGRRIERSYGGETRRWLYDGLRIVREEIGPTPTGGASFVASVVRTFVYGTRGHVPDLVVQGSATYRVVTDHLGSVRQVVDMATGDVVAARSYDAWGRVTSDSTSGGFVALPQAYAGGIYDVQTGLVRFGARDYDSVLGRWTAKDPIGFAGGDSNVYGYVLGDPTGKADPTGLSPLPPPGGEYDPDRGICHRRRDPPPRPSVCEDICTHGVGCVICCTVLCNDDHELSRCLDVCAPPYR